MKKDKDQNRKPILKRAFDLIPPFFSKKDINIFPPLGLICNYISYSRQQKRLKGLNEKLRQQSQILSDKRYPSEEYEKEEEVQRDLVDSRLALRKEISLKENLLIRNIYESVVGVVCSLVLIGSSYIYFQFNSEKFNELTTEGFKDQRIEQRASRHRLEQSVGKNYDRNLDGKLDYTEIPTTSSPLSYQKALGTFTDKELEYISKKQNLNKEDVKE